MNLCIHFSFLFVIFIFDCFCLDLMQYHIERQLAKGPRDLNLLATTSTMVVLKPSSLICLYLLFDRSLITRKHEIVAVNCNKINLKTLNLS